jgi:hypothetical protein
MGALWTTANISWSSAFACRVRAVSERRLTNSELHLQKLTEQEQQEEREEKGILELFDDADQPLDRDQDR